MAKRKRKGRSKQKAHGARNHKDKLFCDIFSIKENALSLFNAANGTDYADVEALEVYTIKEVLYIAMHNDLAVCFHDYVELFEQQSTKSANIPLREFLYSAEVYDKWLVRNRKNVLGTKLVKIPAPKCFELYNGLSEEPEMSEKRLSDAFEHPSPGYEWTVYVINVNAGRNKKSMDKCMPLNAYAVFVQRVRGNIAAGMTLDRAINEAVDYCIEHNLLATYFAENRGRVVKMVHTKYAVKIYEDALREEERKNGRLEMLTDMIVSMLRRKRKPSYIAEELEVTPEMVLSTAKKYNITVVQ